MKEVDVMGLYFDNRKNYSKIKRSVEHRLRDIELEKAGNIVPQPAQYKHQNKKVQIMDNQIDHLELALSTAQVEGNIQEADIILRKLKKKQAFRDAYVDSIEKKEEGEEEEEDPKKKKKMEEPEEKEDEKDPKEENPEEKEDPEDPKKKKKPFE